MTLHATFRRVLPAVVAMLGAAVLMPATVHAHTDFDYSLPTDGASVGEPIGEITVAFTLPVTLVGNGFAVLDPQENELAPFAVTDDDTVFRLQFDPPLAGGTVGVRYEVRAEDGHVLSGSFVFFVDAPPPTTSPPTSQPAPTTTAVGPTTLPVVTTSPATTPPSTTTSEVTQGEQVGDAAAAPVSIAVVNADGGDDSGDSLSLVLIIAAAIALGVGGVFLVRSRTSSE